MNEPSHERIWFSIDDEDLRLEKWTFPDNLTTIGFEAQARDVCRNDMGRATYTGFPLFEKRPRENQ